MRVVMRLKSTSHEPQSRSIAILVRGEVVSGPGVSRMGSTGAFMQLSSAGGGAGGTAARRPAQ